MKSLQALVGRRLSWENRANPKRLGTVVAVRVTEGKQWLIGAGGMKPISGELVVVFEDHRLLTVAADIVDGHAWRWENGAPADEAECAKLHLAGQEKRTRQIRESQTQAEARDRTEKAWTARLEALKPSWAKAVIVAELEKDKCDSMTDYYATSTQRRVILAWSKNTRDLFPEMRKAAAKFEPTAHLATPATVNQNRQARPADKPKWWHPEDEHREKYSMGHGYYLKATGRYSTGWRVCKMHLGGYLFPADLSILEA